MDAYAKSSTPQSEKDRWATPVSVYARICEVIGITPVWDVCAEGWSSKCEQYWDDNDNALSIDWAEAMHTMVGHELPIPVWMNPPYSDLGTWCDYASEQAAKGIIVVGLVPENSSARWFQRVEKTSSALFRPDGRINFQRPDGTIATGQPLPSIVPIWTPWRVTTPGQARFRRIK